MEPKKSKKSTKSKQVADGRTFLKSTEAIPTDVLGSYTGTPDDGERPVQDADDL